MEQLDWERDYERPLASVLSVDVDKSADPAPPWLVVHLHTIKSESRRNAALDAVARLHLLTCSMGSVTAQVALWTRVLTSRMMVLPLRERDADVKWFARFLYGSATNTSIRVLLDWTGVKVDTIVCPLFKEFLRRTRPPNTPPLTVGLSLPRCRLTGYAIAMLDEVLCEAKRARHNHALVDIHSLGRLDLSDNGLIPDALKTLATLLDRHDVQDIRLENALAWADNDATVEAISSLLRSVLAPTIRHQSPVSVSLANNSLDPRYYQVICEALKAMTRPLRRLSLARTMSMYNSDNREGCWTWLAPIMLSAQPVTQATECELDLSGNPLYPMDLTCFRQRVGVLLAEHFELVRNALGQQLPVSCRVKAHATTYLTPNDGGDHATALDPSVQYPVMAMSPTGYALVASGPERWVKYESIASLDIAGAAISRHKPRFQALVLDEMRVNERLSHFLMVIGMELRRVSTRQLDMTDFIAHMPVFSPQIAHLDVEACRLTSISQLTAVLQNGLGCGLASLNLTSNPLGVRSVEQLAELYRAVPEFQLRHLQLRKCHIGARGLTQLEEILWASRWLEIVELDRSVRRDDDANEDSEYAAQRDRLSGLYDNSVVRVDALPLRTRLAFLSLGAQLDAVKAMDAPVASLVLEFAATPVVRHLFWS